MSSRLPKKAFRSTGDLAAHLGISRWAVSRVLNGQPGVSESTRQRVEALIAESGFEPNRMARGLRGGATGLVGVLFQEIESPALARKAAQLQQRLRGEGYRAVIELSAGDQNWEAETLRHFMSLRVEGIVMVGTTLKATHPLIKQLVKQQVPAVVIDPASPLPMPTVQLDRSRAMAEAVHYLHGLGHRKFALLGLESDPILGPHRMRGIERARPELNLSAADFRSFHLPDRSLQDFLYGADLGRLWVEQARECTGIIANNDRIAIGALRALREAGLHAPTDFSIIGFDNTDVSSWVEPALTTIDQQIETLMSTAIQLLRARMSPEPVSPPPVETVEARMILRDTTGPVPTVR
ncbi:MAG: LacI family DNA-binding transcriptional regulator [Verrucomicrobiota bacterium JB022]|nr:LacI family DNA-binding transcriptional regulator [Verrucomicrobiota bacterium JB022]